MEVLGVGQGGGSGEIKVGFRSGWVRNVSIAFGGASIGAISYAFLQLAKQQTTAAVELLAKWGFYWLLGLAAMVFVWDLAKRLIAHVGNLAAGVQSSAVAITRIADRDDRERDRLATETAFVGQRLERLSREFDESRQEQRAQHKQVVQLLSDTKRSLEQVRGSNGAA